MYVCGGGAAACSISLGLTNKRRDLLRTAADIASLSLAWMFAHSCIHTIKVLLLLLK